MALEGNHDNRSEKPQPGVVARDDHHADQTESSPITYAREFRKSFARLTPWRIIIILSVVIALVAFIVQWQRGLVLEFFRQGQPFDRFALVLLAIVILPRQFERFGLPGMLGLILAGLLLGPNGLALSPKLGEVAHFFSEWAGCF